MKVALIVAEKPKVARAITESLSLGRINKFTSFSKHNPLFEFDHEVNGEMHRCRVTSMLGHLVGLRYPEKCRSWIDTDYEELFTTVLEQVPLESARNVIKNLRRYGKDIDTLVLWLDDDVEGDSIGQDVCDIVQAK